MNIIIFINIISTIHVAMKDVSLRSSDNSLCTVPTEFSEAVMTVNWSTDYVQICMNESYLIMCNKMVLHLCSHIHLVISGVE